MVRRARGFATGCGMVVALFAGWWLSSARGQQAEGPPLPTLPEGGLHSGCLQVVSQPGEPLVAIVYDTEQKVLGVYHIDRDGAIELKGIRPIRWDLQMLHYNGKGLLPEDVRNGLTR